MINTTDLDAAIADAMPGYADIAVGKTVPVISFTKIEHAEQFMEAARQHSSQLKAVTGDAKTALEWVDERIARIEKSANGLPLDSFTDYAPLRIVRAALTAVSAPPVVPDARNDMPKRGAFFDMVWAALKEVRGDMVKRMSVDNIQTFAGILYDKIAAPQPTTQEHTGRDVSHD